MASTESILFNSPDNHFGIGPMTQLRRSTYGLYIREYKQETRGPRGQWERRAGRRERRQRQWPRRRQTHGSQGPTRAPRVHGPTHGLRTGRRTAQGDCGGLGGERLRRNGGGGCGRSRGRSRGRQWPARAHIRTRPSVRAHGACEGTGECMRFKVSAHLRQTRDSTSRRAC